MATPNSPHQAEAMARGVLDAFVNETVRSLEQQVLASIKPLVRVACEAAVKELQARADAHYDVVEARHVLRLIVTGEAMKSVR